MRMLIVHSIDAALSGAPALIRAIGNNKKRDPNNREDCEKNERNHLVLPGPGPNLHGVRTDGLQASSLHKMPLTLVQ